MVVQAVLVLVTLKSACALPTNLKTSSIVMQRPGSLRGGASLPNDTGGPGGARITALGPFADRQDSGNLVKRSGSGSGDLKSGGPSFDYSASTTSMSQVNQRNRMCPPPLVNGRCTAAVPRVPLGAPCKYTHTRLHMPTHAHSFSHSSIQSFTRVC